MEVVHECTAVERDRKARMGSQMIDRCVREVDVSKVMPFAQEMHGRQLLRTLCADELCKRGDGAQAQSAWHVSVRLSAGSS